MEVPLEGNHEHQPFFMVGMWQCSTWHEHCKEMNVYGIHYVDMCTTWLHVCQMIQWRISEALEVTSSEPLTQPDNLLSAHPLSGVLLKPLSLRHWSITKGSSRRNFQPLKLVCQHHWCAHWSYQSHVEWFIMTADACQVYRCHKDKRKKGIKRSTYDEEKTPASSTQTSVASLPDRIFSKTAFAVRRTF